MVFSARVGVSPGGDPARIAAQITTGIGFLGAGAILYSKGSVLRLTTAATIWVIAGIGMAAGAEQYLLALVSTALAISTLLLLEQLESRVGLKGRMRQYVLRVKDM